MNLLHVVDSTTNSFLGQHRIPTSNKIARTLPLEGLSQAK